MVVLRQEHGVEPSDELREHRSRVRRVGTIVA